MDLIIGTIAAFFLGGVAGWLLRMTQERDERGERGGESGESGETRRPEDAAGGVTAETRRGPSTPAGASRGDRARAGAAKAPAETGGRGGTAAAPTTVLLADDRMELVSIHRAHLERHGYRVVTATDGEAALALARAEHPAVAVLDHSMPGRSGIDVTRSLKADPATADIVVLLMTAHSYGAIGSSARAAGVSGFMSKPCEPSRVLREVAAHTRRAG